MFKIPQIKIRASNTITNLNSSRIKIESDEKKYEIAEISQHVNIEMKGVPQNDSIDDLTMTVPDSECPKYKSKRMCLRNPFWIVLKNKGCAPYLVAFINKASDCS